MLACVYDAYLCIHANVLSIYTMGMCANVYDVYVCMYAKIEVGVE